MDQNTRVTPAAEPDVPVIDVKKLNFYYGNSQALYNLNLTFPRRQVTALIGPSGCGKSTFLRCLNRMNDLVDGTSVEGKILLGGTDINGPGMDVIELRRRVGMVFQKSNPFPKSIYENVIYGLRIAGVKDKAALDEAVERSLKGAALWDEVKDRLQESALGMSGGQQQRLCIAMQRPRPQVDGPGRRADRRTAPGLHHHHRHPQHAAGGAGLRPYRLPLRGAAGGTRRDQKDLHETQEQADRRLHHRPIRLRELNL